jgi:hypothetical protein
MLDGHVSVVVTPRTWRELRFAVAMAAAFTALGLLFRWFSRLSFADLPMTQTLVSVVLVVVLMPLALRLGRPSRRARGFIAWIAFASCMFGSLLGAAMLLKGLGSNTLFAWTTLAYVWAIGGVGFGMGGWLMSRRDGA